MEVDGLKWPAVTQPGIVVQLLRGSKDKEEFLKLVKPFVSGAEEADAPWNPASPTLASCEITPLEKAKIFQRMVVHERIVPMLTRGVEMEETLLH